MILATYGLVFAFPYGILLALGRRSNLPLIKGLCVGFIELIRGVPLISLLIMASVMLPLFLPSGMTIDKFLRAQVAVILFAGAYIAEIIRGGLQSLPKGQFEAADAMGLNYVQKTMLIILPQALRVVIPPLINTFIGFFKDTSLVLIIGIFDFLNSANQALVDPNWAGFPGEVYLFAAFIYFCFCFSMSRYSQVSRGRAQQGNAPLEAARARNNGRQCSPRPRQRAVRDHAHGRQQVVRTVPRAERHQSRRQAAARRSSSAGPRARASRP